MTSLRTAQKTSWQMAQAARGPEPVAMSIKNARILAGYDLSEVAAALRIRPAHLEALEESRFSDLPPLVYAQGFVGACADYLHLDKADLIARFKAEVEGRNAAPLQPELSAPAALDHQSERRLPSLALIGAGFVLVLLIYGVFQAAMPDHRETALAVPPLPARLQMAEAEATSPPVSLPVSQPVLPPAVAASAPTLATEPASAPEMAPEFASELAPQVAPVLPAPAIPAYTGAGLITLKAHGDGWIQIVDASGQRLESLVLKAGETYRLPGGTTGLSLITGDISTLEFMVDQQTVSVSAPSRKTRYQVQLDPARLVAGAALVN